MQRQRAKTVEERRRAGLRRSAREQQDLLTRFEEAISKGALAGEAAHKVKTPLSSLYRWRAKLTKERTRRETEFGLLPPVEDAINILLNQKSYTRFQVLEAALRFMVWLRWPTDDTYHSIAVASCLIAYLHQKSGADTLDQLQPEVRDALLKYLRLKVLRRMFSHLLGDWADLPVFELHPIDQQPFNEIDAFSFLVWSILSFEPEKSRPYLKASLSKSFYLLQANAFRFQWQVTNGIMIKLWRSYAPAAPFHYVERFHPTLDWTLDPQSKTFGADVDSLLKSQKQMTTYFGQCKAAIEMLRMKLYARSLVGANFPTLPNDLRVSNITPPIMSVKMTKLLREYRSGAGTDYLDF